MNDPGSAEPRTTQLERERSALSLLLRAGRRTAPPAEVTKRVYASMLDVWSEETQRRRRSHWKLATCAAAVVLAVGAAGLFWHRGGSPITVANIIKLRSDVTVTRNGGIQPVMRSFELQTGDRIEVPSGGSLAAQRADGMSVRIAGPAYVVWNSPERIELQRGRVYVDLGPRAAADRPTFEVQTPLARIEHIGTRFVAESDDDRVRVAVRDGQVRMTSSRGGAVGILTGQAAEAAANGQINRVAPPTRTEWEWVDALAPPCGIEGRSLYDVLTDLAREAGLKLAFASSEIERRAHGLTLHGPAIDVPPRMAIEAVLAATDLDADLADQRVILRDRITSKL